MNNDKKQEENEPQALNKGDVSGSTSKELDFSDCVEKCCCFPVSGLCNKELQCYGNDKCRLDDVLEYYR